MRIGRKIGVRKMGRLLVEMGDYSHLTEVAYRGSGGIAAWGRQRAGWGKAAAGCSSPRGALCVERVAVAFAVLHSVCSF